MHVLGDLLATPQAEVAQDPRDGGEALLREGPGAGGLHDRVEHQPLHVLRVLGGVAERHLRPVGDAEQRDLVHADGAPHGIDVVHRVAGGVEGAPGPMDFAQRSAACACCSGVRDRREQAPAAQRAREARAALVEHDEVAVAQRGPEVEGPVEDVGRGRLARAAGQRDQRALAAPRERRRSTCSFTVPGTAPERSSGTVIRAQSSGEPGAQA